MSENSKCMSHNLIDIHKFHSVKCICLMDMLIHKIHYSCSKVPYIEYSCLHLIHCKYHKRNYMEHKLRFYRNLLDPGNPICKSPLPRHIPFYIQDIQPKYCWRILNTQQDNCRKFLSLECQLCWSTSSRLCRMWFDRYDFFCKDKRSMRWCKSDMWLRSFRMCNKGEYTANKWEMWGCLSFWIECRLDNLWHRLQYWTSTCLCSSWRICHSSMFCTDWPWL